MSGGIQRRQDTNHRRQTTYGRDYISGNTVRKLDETRRQQEAPRKQLSHTTRKNRDKVHHMNPGYVLFLAAALALAGFVLIGYIRLQSDITSSVKNIAKLESQLNSLKMENDEELSRIQSSVDLEEIKKVAIGELGMTYAKDGQIIEFSAEGSDYVRQLAEVPNE